MFSLALSGFFLRDYQLHILLGLLSRDHDQMSAFATLEPEINANPQDFPFLASAGMGLLHFQFISYMYVHNEPASTD